MLYPFWDAPEVGIPVVWYAVPRDRPGVPITPFRPHWWEVRDLYQREGVGTPPQKEWTVWRGPYPQSELRPILGTEEEWLRGVSYADYLAGRLPGADRCVPAPQWTDFDMAGSSSLESSFSFSHSVSADVDAAGDVMAQAGQLYFELLDGNGAGDVSSSVLETYTVDGAGEADITEALTPTLDSYGDCDITEPERHDVDAEGECEITETVQLREDLNSAGDCTSSV